MIHNARDFAEELNIKDTIILCVKGKETAIIGEKANFQSQMLNKNKNIQIKSVIEKAKLLRDFRLK
jgi:hypothetical protein